MTTGHGRFPFFPIRENRIPTWKALYRKARVLATTSMLGRIGVVRHTRLSRPPIKSFLESVPQSYRPQIAHGYGRALYFKRFSLAGALRKAQRQTSTVG